MDADSFDLEAFDETVWFNWQQPALPYFLDPCFAACATGFRAHFGVPFFTSILFYRPDASEVHYLASWLLRFDEGVALGRILADMLLVPSFGLATEAAFTSRFETAIELGKKSGRTPSTADELITSVTDLGTAYEAAYVIGAITEPVAWYCEAQLTRACTDAGMNEEATALLMVPAKESILSQAHNRLLTLADLVDRFGAESKEARTAAEAHADEFGWALNNSYAQVRAPTIDDVLTEAAKSKAKSQPRLDMQLREEVYEQLPSHARALVDLNESHGAGMADRRKGLVNRLLGHMDRLGNQLATLLGVEYETLALLAPSEWPLWLEDRDSAVDIAEARRDAYVLTLSPSPLEEDAMRAQLDHDAPNWLREGAASPRLLAAQQYIGSQARSQLLRVDEALGLYTNRPIEGLRGTVASRGDSGSATLITGRLKVILSAEGGSIEPGEILVTGSTTPDFMKLMRRSSAILTQQGGLASHAALTARELKIPCIVGIPALLRRVKTGDLVSADLIDGTVAVQQEVAGSRDVSP